MVERAVQAVEQSLRTMKSALDERMGVKVDVRHPILTWLCDFVGFMMNRFEVSSDGKTPYERIKGKAAQVLGLEFGEKVMYKHAPGKHMEKINARWSLGLFVGVRSRSNELVVVNEDKEVQYVRTARSPRPSGGMLAAWRGWRPCRGTGAGATRRRTATPRTST